jgi:hypothetical protein
MSPTRPSHRSELAGLLAHNGVQQVPLIAFDAGDDPFGLIHELAGVDVGPLVRHRDDRVCSTDPPEPVPGPPSRPRRHGAGWSAPTPTPGRPRP